jgi:ABC-type transport system substrate-binding protein
MVLQLLILILIYSTCTWASCEKILSSRKDRNMINLSFSQMTFDFDPVKAWNYQHYLMIQAISDTLINYDEMGQVTSGIAKKWEVSDNGRSISFYLDENAKFQDGTPITSTDVAKSISRHFYPNSNSLVGPYLKDILIGASEQVGENSHVKGIQIIDEKRIKMG